MNLDACFTLEVPRAFFRVLICCRLVFSGVVTETSGVRSLQQQVVQVSGSSDSGGTAAEPSQGQETSTEVQNSINHACAGSFVFWCRKHNKRLTGSRETKGDVTLDDSQRRFLTQRNVATIMQHYFE